MPELSFVMAGGGNLLEEIKNRAPKNVAVIGWVDAPTFWSAVDCAISTSDNEGMPVALIEAQLSGLPVIATDAGSNAEVVEDGITGVVTTKNLVELIQAIKKLIGNSKLINLMGEASKTRATKEFSIEKMLHMHKYVYLELMK
jgi:glycosyltransferase involved in cell wall biosynthesis